MEAPTATPTKPSGIPWLGEVPAHWEVKRLKDIADVRFSNVDKKIEEGEIPVRLCNYTDVYYGHYLDGTPEYMEATATRSEIERFKLRKGDVLITKDSESPTDIAIAAMVVEDVPDLVCGYHLAMIRADHDQIEPAFLYWQLLSDQVREQYYPLANGITRFALGHGEINGGAFVLPPLPEQRAIAAFLDERTARIDALVARKRRLVQLLKEKRQALITRAVTRGLDPKAKMKESGVPWLGVVPEGWEVAPLVRFIRPKPGAIRTGPFGSQLVAAEMSEGEVKVYNQRTVIDRDFELGDNYITQEKYTELKSFTIEPGDVLVTTRGTIGRCVVFPDSAEPGILHPCLMRIQVQPDRLSRKYLELLIDESGLVLQQLRVMSNATTIEVIYSESLKRVVLLVPPLLEQESILEHIGRATTRIDALVTKVEQAVERLQEYRTALISAAVTGKVPPTRGASADKG